MYVEDCSSKIKKFDNANDCDAFIVNFQKENPDHLATDSGSWIDYVVTGVMGKVHFFTDGIKVE